MFHAPVGHRARLITSSESPSAQQGKKLKDHVVFSLFVSKSHFNNDRPAHKAPGVLK
jgi:hypothetical protein